MKEFDKELWDESEQLIQKIREAIKKHHEETIPSVNLLSAVGLDENANSRILKELLSHSYKGDYYILKSFLHVFLPDSFTETVSQPSFSNEEDRIDLLIKEDGKYSIIFENKYNDAVMQKNQIARYIQIQRESGFKDEQIYVVFLPSIQEGEPTACGWKCEKDICSKCRNWPKEECDNEDSLYGEFEDRYVKVDFKENILQWLKNDILPECRICEPTLFSALGQYIDFLETRFNINKHSNEINMAISQTIKEQIGLTENAIANIDTLHSKYRDLQELLDIIKSEEKEQFVSFLKAIKEKFEDKYPGINVDMSRISETRMPQLLIPIKYNEHNLNIFIGEDNNTKVISCGITALTRETGAAISDALGELVVAFRKNYSFKKGHAWIVYKYIEASEAMNHLDCLIDFANRFCNSHNR